MTESEHLAVIEQTTAEINALTARISQLSAARGKSVRALHRQFGWTVRSIGARIGISGPRVVVIVNGGVS
jgi:hypothetical protein